MSAQLRKATLADLEQLVELEQRGFTSDQFSKAQYRYLLAEANGVIFVVENDGSLIGSASILWRKGSRKARLYSIVVHPEHRGKGLGQRLLDACEREALKHTCQKLVLQVRIDNKTAIEFYTRHGFVTDRRLQGYYDDHSDGYEMTKIIEK